MIYSKSASFPYPVYSNSSSSYNSAQFDLDIDVSDSYDSYVFKGTYDIASKFINSLIENSKVEVYLVIQSKDNKFFVVNDRKFEILVKKSRISLSKRTALQILVMAKVDIDFSLNDELDQFYEDHRSSILVQRNSMIAMSNVIYFDGDIKHPFEIFEKKLNETMTESIRYDIGEETIVINYQKDDYQFSTMANKKMLNYPYIYTGLQKALFAMIRELGDDDSLVLNEINQPSGLNQKLYNLMESKGVEELSYENVDYVIHEITDGIIDKYTLAVKRMENEGY